MLFLGLFLSLTSCTYTRPSSNIFEPTITDAPIPKGYETYTLFLVPSYSLKHAYSEEQWRDLLLAFKSLGNSIGKQNAAIWFFNADRKTPSIERARSIVDQINRSDARNQFDQLNYEMAPIIVFMNYNPETESSDGKRFYTAIQLDNKDPKMIIKFMDELTQLIRNDNVHFGTLENKQMILKFYEILSTIKEVTIGNNLLKVNFSANTAR